MSRAVKGLIVTWIVISLLLAIGGGFYWGMKYQKNHGSSNVDGNVIPNPVGISPSASSSSSGQDNIKTNQPSGNPTGNTSPSVVK